MLKVISANTLARGVVVFLSPENTWSERIEDAAVFTDAERADMALSQAKRDEARAIVVDPFIVDRTNSATGPGSMTLRNAIRAHGPTIAYLPVRPASSASAA